MYYIKNPQGNWLLPEANWYHGRPTFTDLQTSAGQWTEAEADVLLTNPRMHPGSFKELVG